VIVTNGGFGGVQAALAAGVPLVVAGGTEDKPEVAARVAWTGAGIDLRTGTPDAEAVAHAVDTVLTEPAFRQNARRLAADAARHDTLAEISRHLAETRVAGAGR
jgi:UDP:flavonoid glycosyltransferase YjiC (YdhE family)